MEIIFSADQTNPNTSNLLKDLQAEIEALEIGNVTPQMEEPKEGELVIDWLLIAFILGIAVNSATFISEVTNIIKNIIEISNEIRSRYAADNATDINNVPKIEIKITNNILVVPCNKNEEEEFIKKITNLGD